MGTLSIENREEMIRRAEAIFGGCDFDGCHHKISVLAHANYSDCIEGLAEDQRANLKESVDHIEYSLDMHQKILESKLKNLKDSESIERHKTIAKEALELEIMAVFRAWPVF